MAFSWPPPFLPQTLKVGYPELILAIACFLFLYHFPRRHRLEPTNWPVIGMLPAIISHFDHLHDYVVEATREVGCTFWFKGPWFMGLDFLITCDPANINHMLNTNFHNYPKGSDFAEIFDVLGDGLFNVDAEPWRLQRKMAHGFFSQREFRSFMAQTVREKAQNGLRPILDGLAQSGAVVDIQTVLMRFAFDVTCVMVFGVDPGSLSVNSPTVPFAQAMDDSWEVLFFRHVVPKSLWKLMRRLRLGKERKLAKAWQVIDQFITPLISERRNEMKSKPKPIHGGTDLLTSYINQPLEEIEQMFETDKFLRDTMLTMMIAGRDGPAMILSWLLWLLSKNPLAEAKILEELRAHSSSSGSKLFDEDQLGSMVYLHGAVCETLRFFPPVAIEHKTALEAEVLPSGHRVEKGGRILFSGYAMGRKEGVWGKDCMEFRPERWISEDGKVRHVPSYKFLAFNSGPRICPGKAIALSHIKTVAAMVLSSYEVEVVDGGAVVPKNAVLLRMRDGMRVRIRKRAL